MGLSSELAAGHWESQQCSSLALQRAASQTPHGTAEQFGYNRYNFKSAEQTCIN